ncbi:serine kinase [Sphingomonas sp. Root710]|uniref:3-oxo-tetronate kinase n=1 Tax=Sphingomonas sp. Root710 TaxID=1736594 RepID=UPI0006F30AEC|nr:3-oxo-tetronate kinase [Sphingomonas sp. Root710]KRB82989.1 serine kinase [Sphingomonas sp. Root710]
MTLGLGCIADDYTGATDLANTLTRNGLRTIQLQGVPTEEINLPEVDAIVIALKSRSIEPDRAITLSLAADAWLRGRGAGHVMFKICSTFDSTDRGNIGPVIDALRERHGGAAMPVCPAFPETGRTVYNGYLFVGDVLLSESPLKDHPLNPMRDSNLVRVLERQSRYPVALAHASVVEAGTEVLCARIEEQRGKGSVIFDATNTVHLETLGKAAISAGPLSTGASGLGLGLARALASGVQGHIQATPESPPGAVAMIAGSCSRATLEQIAEAERHFPVLQLATDALAEDLEGTVKRALGWAQAYIEQSAPFLVTTSANVEDVLRAQQRHGAGAIAARVEHALADLAHQFAAQGVRKLVIAGGETSGAVVDRLGIKGFFIGPEITAGVPVVHRLGENDGMTLALKSGNFGGVTFFADAVRMLNS